MKLKRIFSTDLIWILNGYKKNVFGIFILVNAKVMAMEKNCQSNGLKMVFDTSKIQC